MLAALAEATYIESSPSPALLSWIEHLVDAERHRRIGVELPAMRAEDAIDDSESLQALAVAIAIRDSLKEQRSASGVPDGCRPRSRDAVSRAR